MEENGTTGTTSNNDAAGIKRECAAHNGVRAARPILHEPPHRLCPVAFCARGSAIRMR